MQHVAIIKYKTSLQENA